MTRNEIEQRIDGTTIIRGISIVDERGMRALDPPRKVVLTGGMTRIGYRAFFGVASLEEVYIDDCVQEIDPKAFQNCRNLKRIRLGSGLQRIGADAFRNIGITELVLPDSVKEMGPRAFYGCRFLREVTLPKSLSVLEEGVFDGCFCLREIAFQDGLKKICTRALSGTALKKLELPEGLEELESEALGEIMDLRTVSIPSGVQKLSSSVFRGCFHLRELLFPGENPVFDFHDGAVLSADHGKLCFVLDNVQDCYEVMDGVREIGPAAFRRCSRLTEVVFPDTVREMGPDCFQDCGNLIRVVFSRNLSSIPDRCCKDNEELHEVVLPAALRKIGEAAFEGTGLEEITLPPYVRVLEKNCFRSTKLSRIELEGAVLEQMDFHNMGLSVCGLALRADSLPVRQFSSDMQMAAAWDYVLRYGQGEPVPAFIEKMCLEYIGSQSLKLWKVDLCRKVILEKKLIQADDFDAFLKMAQESGNPDLTAQLEQYGERCFTEQELASVREKRKLDTQVENARANAPMSTMELRRLWKCQQWGQQSAYQYISGCRASTREVVVPAFIGRTPIVAIGSDAFNEERKRGSLQEEIRKGREQIETVIIEEGIQEICQQGFGSFYSLKNLKLPDSLRYIRRFAFRDCVNLKELTIPRHVGRIGESAFRNCRSLRLLVLQGSKTSLSEVEDPKDIPENLVIRAPEDSPARQWAQEYGVTFEVLS